MTRIFNYLQVKTHSDRRLMNNIFYGKLNNVKEVTLTPNSVFTILEDELITPESVILLEPITATASATFLDLYITNITIGQATIRHFFTPIIDKIFRYAVFT